VYLRTELEKQWKKDDVFSLLQTISGEIYRDKEGRRTLRFERDSHSYFLKYHQGVGWGEIVKNLIQLRAPVISAKNEWQAVEFLRANNIDTMTVAAYGERGNNPATKHSFIVTDDLVDTMSLEDLGQQWRESPPTFETKIALINKLAIISKVMHEQGMNHRDYYLCHFLLDNSFAKTNKFNADTPLFLIDLHRAQLRKKTPERWLVKDLSGLYFSALDVALTQHDLFRFMKAYSGLSLRTLLRQQKSFWFKVEKRALKMRDKSLNHGR